jgi:hypothetical protein
MSHRKAGGPATKAKYIELKDQEDDPRRSINSNSPILPKTSEDFDEQIPPTTLDTDGLENYYKPIDGYEGAHRFDPEYTWDPIDERKVVRKVSIEAFLLHMAKRQCYLFRVD